MTMGKSTVDDNPLWYKDAIIYEMHVRAFADSDGDGIGDFIGLIERLDYLQKLGITAIWLLPFYPSPLRDDGYDIADYYDVNPAYNTLKEFREFLRAAHARGMRVITELVLNHTSDQHPWFKRARRAPPGSPHREFYVWSDTLDKYREAGIIFKDFETSNWTWDPVAKSHYWHRFYSHQPDLNFDSPHVQTEILRIIDFWLRMGVDGFRLDAVPYLFEREGTSCENLPETHAFLQNIRAHVDANFKGRILLAEANQWPEDAATYFGDGAGAQMVFHFPLMPRMFMAIQMENSFPITDILDQTPVIPESCQWAIFLRNHDELTLEMVTDEERDYMYRVYAADPQARINLGIRRRLAPLMGNNRRKIELMNILLFSLPGTPIIYYGDEIGMGDNFYLGDRNGVRTPMQWSPDRNSGFSVANPQSLYLPSIIEPEYHYETVNVENQERNSSSLLWWMRRVIALRKRFTAFSRGSAKFLRTDTPRVLAFVRSCESEHILVVANLSRFPQSASVELSEFVGMLPEEMFSRNRFPIIRETPYFFTMGPYNFFWFVLRNRERAADFHRDLRLLTLRESSHWWTFIDGRCGQTFLDKVLPEYLATCRWFRGKGRTIDSVNIYEAIPWKGDDATFLILIVQVIYSQECSEIYQLPLSWLTGPQAETLAAEERQGAVCRLSCKGSEGILFDAFHVEEFLKQLGQFTGARKKIRKDGGGEVRSHAGNLFRTYLKKEKNLPAGKIIGADQSNTSIRYGNDFILKFYRRLEEGINPDPEMTRFLTEQAGWPNIPAYCGGIEYRHRKESFSLALMQRFVPSHGDAWHNTMAVLSQFVERLLSIKDTLPRPPESLPTIMEAAENGIPAEYADMVRGFHLEMVKLLAERTAGMHRALGTACTDPEWVQEPFTLLYQRSVFQSMRTLARKNLQLLAAGERHLLPDTQLLAQRVLSSEKKILACLHQITGRRISAMKCRIHGDFHLGQALFTGKDFIIIDFEGQPAHPMGERRIRRSPLRDVAGMIRSFHYAAMTTLTRHELNHSNDKKFLETWLNIWYVHVSGEYLRAYRDAMAGLSLVPDNLRDLEVMLRCFLLEKALYEVGYELENRPGMTAMPLKGILMLLQECTEPES